MDVGHGYFQTEPRIGNGVAQIRLPLRGYGVGSLLPRANTRIGQKAYY